MADAASPNPSPLPVCSDSSWGPGVAVEQLGLIASPSHGVLTTVDGRVDLLFKKTKPSSVLCKLRRNGMQEEELEKFVRDVETDESVQVSCFDDLCRRVVLMSRCSCFDDSVQVCCLDESCR